MTTKSLYCGLFQSHVKSFMFISTKTVNTICVPDESISTLSIYFRTNMVVCFCLFFVYIINIPQAVEHFSKMLIANTRTLICTRCLATHANSRVNSREILPRVIQWEFVFHFYIDVESVYSINFESFIKLGDLNTKIALIKSSRVLCGFDFGIFRNKGVMTSAQRSR